MGPATARKLRDVDLARSAELFRALASPIRLFVIMELTVGPRCVHDLSEAMRPWGRAVSQPLLSQHLRVLRDVGLVTTTRRATEVTYRLADEHLGHVVRDVVAHAHQDLP